MSFDNILKSYEALDLNKHLTDATPSDIEDAIAIKKTVFSIILNSEEKRCKKRKSLNQQ